MLGDERQRPDYAARRAGTPPVRRWPMPAALGTAALIGILTANWIEAKVKALGNNRPGIQQVFTDGLPVSPYVVAVRPGQPVSNPEIAPFAAEHAPRQVVRISADGPGSLK